MLISIYVAGEDFLDSLEVGQQLYKSPRGVSCIKCHGKIGNGKTIVKTYYNKKKKKTLRTYPINNLPLAKFKKAFKNHKKSKKIYFMPKYFLTNKEIKHIHNFLKSRLDDG
jgi:cytochrome c553